ncbi:hypothetical protein AC578_7236 [Pseudocercospora eumusae]|uniref:PAC domain-containing protein n=1 Tax=Pseudocercospora eumusae TaxID=321146 RepID=A0A139HWR1_9PEZI|nr:hypothetical protein AC578_7236 [Pseudocercospora eumusae]
MDSSEPTQHDGSALYHRNIIAIITRRSVDNNERAMELSPRNSQKLFQRFPAFRRRRPRHARSEEGLTAALPVTEKEGNPLYTLASSNTSHASLVQQRRREAHRPRSLPLPAVVKAIDNFSQESLVDPALSPRSIVPPYTPLPIPQRGSSAKSDAHHSKRSRQNVVEKHDSHQDQVDGADAEQDDISLDFSGFDDEMLQPERRTSQRQTEKQTDGRMEGRVESHMERRMSDSSMQRSLVSAVSPLLPPTTSITMSPHGPIPNGFSLTNGTSSDAHEEKLPSPDSQTDSVDSIRSAAPPGPVLSPLQNPIPDKSDLHNFEPNNVDDPDSWDVLKPKPAAEDQDIQVYSLEKRAEQLYSADHLRLIFEDPKLLSKFSAFLRKYRPWRVPILHYYWDAAKAIRAIDYADAIVRSLSEKAAPHISTAHPPGPTSHSKLHAAAKEAFDELLKDDLHYFIAHAYVQIVSVVIRRRITGTLAVHLQEASNGLAEVFCVTDPSRPDNPIILISEEFTRLSGCNPKYILGRNCRFLQGPGTTVDSRRRLAIACQEGKDHTEILVNYRRDGSPFLSLVMSAPLIDSRGNVRYFLGAQVDISGLLKNCSGVESLAQLVEQQSRKHDGSGSNAHKEGDARQKVKALSEMFSAVELDIVRKHGGALTRGYNHLHDATPSTDITANGSGRRMLIRASSDESDDDMESGSSMMNDPTAAALLLKDGTAGQLSGIYQHYLLLRPAPSLRILFASPTLRVPGILQSPFLNRIGGSPRMRADLENAFLEGKPVTARVKWLAVPNSMGEGHGKTRWVHCTPLIHVSGGIGLWMVVIIIPDETDSAAESVVSRSASRLETRGPSRPRMTGHDEQGDGRGRGGMAAAREEMEMFQDMRKVRRSAHVIDTQLYGTAKAWSSRDLVNIR